MVGAAPVLSCPVGNTVEGKEPDVIGTYPKVACKICGIHAVILNSESDGIAKVSLIFGRNQIDGTVTESEILSYRAYIGDSDGNKLGGDVLAEERYSNSSEACCGQVYNMSLELNVTAGYPASVVVVPEDSTGFEMTVGEFIPTADLGGTTTTKGADDVSQARQSSNSFGPLAVAVFLLIRAVG